MQPEKNTLTIHPTPLAPTQDALRKLCNDWITALDEGEGTGIFEQVAGVMSGLDTFQASLRQVLPIDKGGFGGLTRAQATSYLRNAGIVVTETEAGYFGFTHCAVAQWESLDAALNAALQEHPEVLPSLLPLPLKGISVPPPEAQP